MNNIIKIFVLFLGLITYSLHSQIVINEYSASNLSTIPDNYSNFEDWIEIYNNGSKDVNLKGYGLTDDIALPGKWKFTDDLMLKSKEFLVIWASGRDEFDITNPHTNFKFTQTKKKNEVIVLTDEKGIKLDEIKISKTRGEQSRGRYPDGTSIWQIFSTPTPASSNINPTFLSNAQTPTFDVKPGF